MIGHEQLSLADPGAILEASTARGMPVDLGALDLPPEVDAERLVLGIPRTCRRAGLAGVAAFAVSTMSGELSQLPATLPLPRSGVDQTAQAATRPPREVAQWLAMAIEGQPGSRAYAKATVSLGIDRQGVQQRLEEEGWNSNNITEGWAEKLNMLLGTGLSKAAKAHFLFNADEGDYFMGLALNASVAVGSVWLAGGRPLACGVYAGFQAARELIEAGSSFEERKRNWSLCAGIPLDRVALVAALALGPALVQVRR